MAFTTQDLSLNISDFSDRFIKPAVAAIANKVDYDGLQQFLNVYNLVGTPGVLSGTPTQAQSLQTILAARARLNQEAAPVDELRNIVVDPQVEVGLISGLTTIFNPQGVISKIFERGALGDNTLGFNFAMDQNTANFTTGTCTGFTVSAQAGGSVQTNAQTVFSLGVSSTTGTMTPGTVFTIPGVFAVNPQSRQSTGVLRNFVVTALAANASTTLSILPTPIFSGQFQNVTSTIGTIPTGTAVITSGASGAAATYSQSLAYHRDAFALGTADLLLPQGVDMAGRASADGISIRMVRQYDINSDQLPTRLDILYGFTTTYSELACRITG